MTNTLKSLPILALAAILCFFAPSAFATTNGGQADTTNTTITAALTNTTNPICVASATGIVLPSLSGSAAGSFLAIDSEIMQVRSNPQTLCYQVTRGMMGSPVTAHANAALVWVGSAATSSGDSSRPFGGPFISYAPSGPCTPNQQYVLPVIIAGEPNGYSRSGQPWTCFSQSASTVGKWGPVQPSNGVTFGGTMAAATGAQIVPGSAFILSGTNAITSFTLPTGFAAGQCLTIMPTGAFTTTATNNIAKASTAVANKTLYECYDGTTLNPSY